MLGSSVGRDFRDSRERTAFFRVQGGERGALPTSRDARIARTPRSDLSWETLTRERARQLSSSRLSGSRVASRRKPGRFRDFWSSARGRDAPEHMSTNATAAIAGPQGGGKAGGGGNGVSDSASVARRCASTLGTRARRRVTTQPTHVATGFSPLTERRHPFSFLTPSQAAERADVPHGAYRARAPFLSRRQGKPHASWRPRAARTEPSSPRPLPERFLSGFRHGC